MLNITLEDINDHAPVFLSGHYDTIQDNTIIDTNRNMGSIFVVNQCFSLSFALQEWLASTVCASSSEGCTGLTSHCDAVVNCHFLSSFVIVNYAHC